MLAQTQVTELETLGPNAEFLSLFLGNELELCVRLCGQQWRLISEDKLFSRLLMTFNALCGIL